MKKNSVLVLILFLFSCQEKKTDSVEIPLKKLVKKENTSKSLSKNPNSDILEILKILPDKSFNSWGWSKESRNEFAKNYSSREISKKMPFNKVFNFKPNHLEVQVVDGVWAMSIYKISENNFIVITDDIAGDGNDFYFFEFKNGKLHDLDDNFLFNSSQNILKTKNQDCENVLSENYKLSDFDLSNENYIKIDLLIPEENSECFNKDKVILQFNPSEKKFILK